jgi:hypothetical protein
MRLAKFPERVVVAVSLALLTSAHAAKTSADGKLDRIGQQARRDAPSPPPSSGSNTSYRSSLRGRSKLDHALGQLSAYVVLSPWLIPNHVLEERRPWQAAYRVRFADYPYADDAPGFLREEPLLNVASIDDDRMLREHASRRTQRVAARLGAESGFDGRITRYGFDARVQFPMRLELDTDWSLYREADKDGVDSTWLGREHLSVRFAESPTLQFRSGLGPQHLRDARGWVHGIDATWGLDAFPGRPVFAAFEASAGLLGKAFTAGVYARIGLVQGPFEFSAGWHQRWIAYTPLGGPFLAIRFWL